MRMPILSQHHVGEFSRQHVDQRYNLMSTRHRQIAAGAEVILNIDHQEDVVTSYSESIGQSAAPPRAPPAYTQNWYSRPGLSTRIFLRVAASGAQTAS